MLRAASNMTCGAPHELRARSNKLCGGHHKACCVGHKVENRVGMIRFSL